MKNMQTKSVLLFFVLSVVTLVTSVFAWVSLSNYNKVGGIESNIPDFSKLTSFYVTRSGDEQPTEINSIEDMHSVFGNTRPGETYLFEINVNNSSAKELDLVVNLNGLSTSFNNQDVEKKYDLKRVFYIENGLIRANYNNDEKIIDNTLDVLSTEEVLDFDQRALNKYRLNNLINNESSTTLTTLKLAKEQSVVISFKLIYGNTTDINYQYNMLNINGIYIIGQ